MRRKKTCVVSKHYRFKHLLHIVDRSQKSGKRGHNIDPCGSLHRGKVKHELRVQIHELRVQIHELRLQIYLRVTSSNP